MFQWLISCCGFCLHEIKLVSFIWSGTCTCTVVCCHIAVCQCFYSRVVSFLLKNLWGKNVKRNLSQVSFCERASVRCKVTSGMESQARLLRPACATCGLHVTCSLTCFVIFRCILKRRESLKSLLGQGHTRANFCFCK